MTTWPPPPTAPSAPRPATAPPTNRPPRPPRTSVPAAAWLAAVGAALVLTAASVLVVGAWSHLQPEIKLAGLIVLNGLVAAAAAGARRAFPVVARALAHLAATLAVPSGVAVMATAHQTWPAAVAVGGAVGVGACLLQSRRWSAPWLVPAAEVAGALSLAGMGTLAEVPLGLALVVVAVVLLVARQDRSAARLAILAAAVPSLAALGARGIGPGTTVRLGARGDVLTWAAPVAGMVGAGVLAVVARRRRNLALVPPAALALLTGAVAGLAQGHAPYAMWAGLPALALLLALAVGDRLARDTPAGTSNDGTAGVPFTATAAGVISGLSHEVLAAAGSIGATYLAAVAFVAHRDLAGAGTLCLWAVAFLAAGLPGPAPADGASPWWTVLAPLERAAAALTLVAAAGAATGRHLGPVTAGVALLALASIVAALRPRATEGSPWYGLLAERAALAPVVLLAAAHGGDRRTVALTVVLAVAGAVLASLAGAPRRIRAEHVLTATLAVGALALVGWGWPATAWAWTLGLVAAVGVLVAGRRVHEAAAVVAPLAAQVLLATHAGHPATTLVLLLAAAAVTGMAMVFERWTPLDTLGVALVALATSIAAQHDLQAYVSLGIVVLGAQAFLYGLVRQERTLKSAGAIAFAAGTLSLPWTSGFVPWLVDGLAPHGMTGTDLAVAVLGTALLIGGAYLRHGNRTLSSWIAYGPGLVLAGLHLLATQVPANQDGRIAVTVGLGVGAVAVGGLRRLAAPLLLGTALLVAGTVLAAGRELASLPVWVWLAAGGLALLGLALLIEKRATPGDDDAPKEGERLVQVVWRRFS